jgi:hypothetical protein
MNRRSFLRLGASAGVTTSLGGFPSLASALTPTCTSPVPAGTIAVPWVEPCLCPKINRTSVYDSTYNWTRLGKAYAAMRALPSSDPRSLAAQQNMHAWYCATCPGNPNDIHGHWTFFAWHRAFLYFHERILGSLVNDMTLRLPYWDWENPSRQLSPTEYYVGALNDTTRELGAGQSVNRDVPGGIGSYDFSQIPAQVGLSFADFGGDATSAGTVEVQEHGFVNMSIGGSNGNMGSLELAAGDPIFYAHHANIDRLWYSWEQHAGNTDPGGAFSQLTFTFYDEKKQWRSISASQMVPLTKLCYCYDTVVAPPGTVGLKSIAFGVAVGLPLLQGGILASPSPSEMTAITQATDAAVSMDHLQFTGTGAFLVQVQNGAGTTNVGTFYIVPHRKDQNMTSMQRAANIRFTIRPSVAQALSESGATVTIQSPSNGASASMRAVFHGLRLLLR